MVVVLYIIAKYFEIICPCFCIGVKVSTCEVCQRGANTISTITPELHPVPVKSPWYHIGIDFIGPIHPTSSQGNRYILTVSDYFSKWAEAIPLPSKHAFVTANSLFKVCIFLFSPLINKFIAITLIIIKSSDIHAI